MSLNSWAFLGRGPTSQPLQQIRVSNSSTATSTPRIAPSSNKYTRNVREFYGGDNMIDDEDQLIANKSDALQRQYSDTKIWKEKYLNSERSRREMEKELEILHMESTDIIESNVFRQRKKNEKLLHSLDIRESEFVGLKQTLEKERSEYLSEREEKESVISLLYSRVVNAEKELQATRIKWEQSSRDREEMKSKLIFIALKVIIRKTTKRILHQFLFQWKSYVSMATLYELKEREHKETMKRLKNEHNIVMETTKRYLRRTMISRALCSKLLLSSPLMKIRVFFSLWTAELCRRREYRIIELNNELNELKDSLNATIEGKNAISTEYDTHKKKVRRKSVLSGKSAFDKIISAKQKDQLQKAWSKVSLFILFISFKIFISKT
jgi:hypothetical protein